MNAAKITKTSSHRKSKSRKHKLINISRTNADLSHVTRRIDFDDNLSSAKSDHLPASPIPNPISAQSETNTVFDWLLKTNIRNSESLNSKELLSENLEHSNYSFSVNRNLDLNSPANPADYSNETFIPAKEFLSDSFTRERVTSDYFSETDTPSKLRQSTERLRIRKPLNEYIAYSSDEELDEWWKQPKTDYTYSASLSYRENITPERKIGSPNMSRKGLRGRVGTVASPPFSHRLELPTSAADNLALGSRAIPRAGLSAFSDESDTEEAQFIRSSQTSTSKKYRISSTSHSTAKESQSVDYSTSVSDRLEYGLDLDSDDEVYSPSPQIARPMVRKGTASLVRRAPTSSTTSVQSSETYSNSLNGRIYSSRFNNHVHTSSGTTTTVTTGVDSTNGYYLSKLHILQQSKWQDVLLKSRDYIYTKTINFLSVICFYTILWSSHLLNSVKRKFSTKNSSSGSSIYTRVKNFLNNRLTTTRTTSTTTTTTVLSRKQTVVNYLQDTYSWYGRRRRRSPFLWGWLPLLLLLLLIPYLLYGRGERDQWTRSQMLYKSNTAVQDGFSFISQKVSHLWTLLSDATHSLFNFLQYLILFIYESVVISCTWLGNLIYSLFRGLKLLFITDVESHTKSSDVSPKSYSSMTFLSSGFSYFSKGTQYLGSSLVSSASNIWVLGAESLSAVWSGFLWILFTIWSLISSGSSGVFGYVCLLVSEIGKLPYKAYMSIPVAVKSTKTPVPYEPVQYSTLQGDSEELVQQIILNPALHGLILNSIAERERSLKENLLSEFRDNLELDIQKLKAEMAPTRKQVEGLASKTEILVLKTQVDHVLNKFANVETILNKVLSQQEKDLNLVADFEDMKLMLQDMSASVSRLNDDIKSLQDNQTAFEAKLNSCCRNSSLTLEQMRNHLRVLLSDLVGGLDSQGGYDENLRVNLREWMGKYFVAKEQLETKLNDLSLKMTTTSSNAAQETQRQTTELVMNSIVNQIRGEMRAEREQLQKHIDKNKEVHEKEQVELRHIVEKSTAETGEELLLSRFVKSLSTNEMEPELYEKLVDALRPFISITLDEKLNKDLPSVIDEKVSQAVEDHILTAEMKIAQMEQKYSINVQRNFSIAINDTDIDKIVKAALLKYDADKTGMVDHALESGGGSIISTRCTEGYQGHQAELIILGYSLYRYSTNTPRSIIQPERNPGQCYAFKGSQGYIVIQFPGPVRISAFSLEHIPKVLTPSGTIDSAPREFSISGLQKLDEEGFDFGTFVYKDNEEPLQYFPVQNISEEYFNYVELKIHSNHGNMQYTCIYRFRVHGVRNDIRH